MKKKLNFCMKRFITDACPTVTKKTLVSNHQYCHVTNVFISIIYLSGWWVNIWDKQLWGTRTAAYGGVCGRALWVNYITHNAQLIIQYHIEVFLITCWHFLFFSTLLPATVNKQVVSLSEELARRVEDSLRQQEEISALLGQIVDMEQRCKGVRHTTPHKNCKRCSAEIT